MKAGMTEPELVICEASLQLRLPFEAQPLSPHLKKAGTQPKLRLVKFPEFVSRALRLAEGAEVAKAVPASQCCHGSLREKCVAAQKIPAQNTLLIQTVSRLQTNIRGALHLGFTFCPPFEALSPPRGSGAGATKSTLIDLLQFVVLYIISCICVGGGLF